MSGFQKAAATAKHRRFTFDGRIFNIIMALKYCGAKIQE